MSKETDANKDVPKQPFRSKKSRMKKNYKSVELLHTIMCLTKRAGCKDKQMKEYVTFLQDFNDGDIIVHVPNL
ncbi:hypothetical protein [Desulfoscipio gibsoniae]|uniref:Uncharacterized protein n=1 Tax=Desulfoscipio gibsoniae DSM 7213 TaxID=767817 RepID=R4KM93_9FIRM|nr:hypothetical protein [Desulfoscipio gibsoniae]AGL03804.1 hypothetical protein Desgi_4577 [Desulfoscipio gibsoniae DSM 7213]